MARDGQRERSVDPVSQICSRFDTTRGRSGPQSDRLLGLLWLPYLAHIPMAKVIARSGV